jgi:hypothetical protein
MSRRDGAIVAWHEVIKPFLKKHGADLDEQYLWD